MIVGVILNKIVFLLFKNKFSFIISYWGIDNMLFSYINKYIYKFIVFIVML